jgi:hypothetical protein
MAIDLPSFFKAGQIRTTAICRHISFRYLSGHVAYSGQSNPTLQQGSEADILEFSAIFVDFAMMSGKIYIYLERQESSYLVDSWMRGVSAVQLPIKGAGGWGHHEVQAGESLHSLLVGCGEAQAK